MRGRPLAKKACSKEGKSVEIPELVSSAMVGPTSGSMMATVSVVDIVKSAFTISASETMQHATVTWVK